MVKNNLKPNSRLNRRKNNKSMILNVLIGIVLVLIIVTVINIVTGDDETKRAADEDSKTTIKEDVKDNTESDSSTEETEEPEDTQSVSELETTESEAAEDAETTENEENNSEENITTEQSDDANVETEEVDSTWEPIGTSQTGEHVSSYDSKSVDWQEKLQALSYASGLDSSNMYVKHLGNGGSPQKSVGTITSKDGKEIYRIHLEWVDGEGWKPTTVEKLKSL